MAQTHDTSLAADICSPSVLALGAHKPKLTADMIPPCADMVTRQPSKESNERESNYSLLLANVCRCKKLYFYLLFCVGCRVILMARQMSPTHDIDCRQCRPSVSVGPRVDVAVDVIYTLRSELVDVSPEGASHIIST